MSRLVKPSPAEELATQPVEAWEGALTLKPAELEEIIARLCACGTRRIKSARPRRSAKRCADSTREWCRLGDRAPADSRYAETRFG